jgi:hypothetical protein
MSYEATVNEDIVKQVTDKEIDLSVLVAEYITLRTAWFNRPQPKTTPDQETLNFWNAEIEIENAGLMGEITALYYRLKPIYEAGLLPSKYEDEYQQLESFVNG